MSITCTQVTLTFFNPSAGSPYRSLYGGSVEEAQDALPAFHWPRRHGSSAATTGLTATPVTEAYTSPPSSPVITISDSEDDESDMPALGAPPSIPHASASSPGTPLDLWSDQDESYAQSARRAREILLMQTPPSQRWYTVTRGLGVGVVQGM